MVTNQKTANPEVKTAIRIITIIITVMIMITIIIMIGIKVTETIEIIKEPLVTRKQENLLPNF